MGKLDPSHMFDPIVSWAMAIFFMNIGGRFMVLPVTEAQKRILQHPMFHALVLMSIFYVSTRNLLMSALLTCVVYVLMFVLLNEHHPMNLYSQSWLANEGFVLEDPSHTLLDRYRTNLARIQSKLTA